MLKELMESAQKGELDNTIAGALENAGVDKFTRPLPYNENVAEGLDIFQVAKDLGKDFAQNVAGKLTDIGQGLG